MKVTFTQERSYLERKHGLAQQHS